MTRGAPQQAAEAGERIGRPASAPSLLRSELSRETLCRQAARFESSMNASKPADDRCPECGSALDRPVLGGGFYWCTQCDYAVHYSAVPDGPELPADDLEEIGVVAVPTPGVREPQFLASLRSAVPDAAEYSVADLHSELRHRGGVYLGTVERHLLRRLLERNFGDGNLMLSETPVPEDERRSRRYLRGISIPW